MENFANDFSTTLSGAITSGAVSLVVTSATGAPAPNFRVRIDNELMLVAATSGTTWTVTRGIEGTTAAAHAAGVSVVCVLTAGVVVNLRDGLLAAAGPVFYRPSGPCFVKTSANTLAIAAGTRVGVADKVIRFDAQTAVSMPSLTMGEDYSVWVKPDGTAVCVADPYSSPASAPVAGARKIGGFHYSLTPAGTTVAGGGFATTGGGMIWTQADVDLIAGINAWSIWDLGYRPACPSPRGMTRTVGGIWVDVYLTGPEHITYGTSRAGTAVASGTVLPKKPLAYNGNGTASYGELNWWDANEIARAHGKRLLREFEFSDAAFGVTEAQSIGGSNETYPATLRNAGYTSKYGVEQATGHEWIWSSGTAQDPASTGPSWADAGGRGAVYSSGRRSALFGGDRGTGPFSGSRSASWNSQPSNSNWAVGMRAACDQLQSLGVEL